MRFPESRNPNGRNKAVNQRRKKKLLGQQLIAAAGDGDLARIKKLEALGADVNYQNRSGETPLTFAAAWNQLDAARLLLQLEADPNVADKSGGTALMLAAQHGGPEFVKLLLKYKADARARDKAGNTVLMHADWREGGDCDLMRELILKASGLKQRAIA
jgi:uncharacterized protein